MKWLNNLKKTFTHPILLLVSTVIVSANPARAAKFNFTYAPGTTLKQMIVFETAGKVWSDYLKDDVTINLFVETTKALPENVIGGALPGIISQQEYRILKEKYRHDITSQSDRLAANNMSLLSSRYGFTVNNHFISNNTLNITRASGKALGILDAHDTGLDGYILIKDLADQSIRWNTNVVGDVPNNTVDLFSVALHEIGHTLGFISGLDNPQWLNTLKELENASWLKYLSLIDNVDSVTLLDMFRCNGYGYRDFSSGGNPFFCIDAQRTNLANFASGEDQSLGGDGYQASHWEKQKNILGIMDPTLGIGQRRQITELDKLAMDLLGWDLKSGGTDISTLNSQVRELLTSNPNTAALLAPNWLDENNNGLDDRGELLNDMLVSSEIYEWGWGAYWWGWGAYWWGWGAYWQEQDALNQEDLGLWQHMAWQTVDMSDQSTSQIQSVPESSSNIAILSLGIVGICSVMRRYCRKKGIIV